MTDFSGAALDWLARETGIPAGNFVITPLRGANSSAVCAVSDARKSEAPGYVLRVFDNAQWLAQEPDLARHEAAALQEAGRCGVGAPELVAFAERDAGFGAPVVLMSRLAGDVMLRPGDLRDWSAQLARTLAQIHRHAAPNFGWNYRSWVDAETLRVPVWTTRPRLWERAIEFWRAGEPEENAVFLHRDFHPANVLWQSENVSGVVDWVNACRGPRGLDVAHCRTNLAVLFGVEVADYFRQIYLEFAGGQHHPFWDVASILEVSLPEPEFYRPWAEFGLEVISAREMGERNEIYIESVLKRV